METAPAQDNISKFAVKSHSKIIFAPARPGCKFLATTSETFHKLTTEAYLRLRLLLFTQFMIASFSLSVSLSDECIME